MAIMATMPRPRTMAKAESTGCITGSNHSVKLRPNTAAVRQTTTKRMVQICGATSGTMMASRMPKRE